MKVLFVCSSNKKRGFSNIIPFIESQMNSIINLGIQTDLFVIEKGGFSGYIKSFFKLKKKIRDGNYDLIHAHYNFCGLLSLLSKSRNQKLLVSFMGGDLWGTFDHRDRQTLIGYYSLTLSKVLTFFCDGIIVKSKNLYDLIPISKRKITRIIPNGVDYKKLRPLNREICRTLLKLEKNKEYILFLSDKNDDRKNFRLLEEAFEKLDKNKYSLLTPYPQKHKNLRFFFYASSVLVSTSKIEGSQNIIKEALACNLPVVSTNAGDARGLLENIKGSYLVEYKSEDLKSKIILACKTRSNSRKITSHLRLENVAKNIEEMYNDTLYQRN